MGVSLSSVMIWRGGVDSVVVCSEGIIMAGTDVTRGMIGKEG